MGAWFTTPLPQRSLNGDDIQAPPPVPAANKSSRHDRNDESKRMIRTAIRPPTDTKAVANPWSYNYDTLLPLPPSSEVFSKEVQVKLPPKAKAK
ncbi:hypothetical protein Q1695_007758 [Nippostrongylus brasiliensis]|nr:hypothetical protein Q1695_007758 [Nippostrongylus brasiliensis]